MQRVLPFLCAFGLLAASGAAQLLWTGRGSWAPPPGGRAEVLRGIPATVGDWVGRDGALSPRMLEVAEVDGYLLRHYRDPDGHTVTVLLVRGRPGPVSVHTPEFCYGGVGYDSTARVPLALPTGAPGRPDAFWVIDLTKREAIEPESLRILYGWSTDGAWLTSETPRLDFAGSPVLYKMYLIHGVSGANGPIEDDPLLRFARQFLPELRRTFFASPAPPPAAARRTQARACPGFHRLRECDVEHRHPRSGSMTFDEPIAAGALPASGRA